MTGKRKKRRPVGETIGGIIVGFDQQIFRTTPPVQELSVKAKPVRGLSGQEGADLQVVFPDEDASPEPERTSAEEPPGDEDDPREATARGPVPS
jgi:hypothetical protein